MRKVGMTRTRARATYDMQLASAASFSAEFNRWPGFLNDIRHWIASGIYRVIREDVTYRGIDLSKAILSEAEIHENRAQCITQGFERLNIKEKK